MVKAFVLVAFVVVGLAAGMFAWQDAILREGRRTDTLGWMLARQASLTSDSRQIDLEYIAPPCGDERKLATQIEYRPTEIAVGLRLDWYPGCLMSGGPAHVQLDLAEPLGNRRIVPLDQPNLTPADLTRFQQPLHPPTVDPAFGKDRRL